MDGFFKKVPKVPVIMQMEALECGAACLAMISAYYGKWVPLEKVRKDCGVSRDGSSAKNVLRAARGYGFDVEGYRYEPETLQKEGSFPCIIHWNFNHFVVLNGFQGNFAVLNDPARGTVKVPMEQFDQSFTGVCIELSPGENFVKEGAPKSTLAFAKKRLTGAGGVVAFTVLTTIIGSLIGIVTPVFSRIFIDRLLTRENPEWASPFFMVFAAFIALQIIIETIKAVYNLRIHGKMEAVGYCTYMWHILRLPMEFYSQRMAGDVQKRKESNATVASELVNTFAPLVLSAVMMVFYLGVMLSNSVLLTAMGLVSVLVNVLFARFISEKRVNLTRVNTRDQGKLAGTTVAGIEMIESIKAAGAENGFFERWAGYQASANMGEVRFKKLNRYMGLLPQFVSTAMNAIITSTGIWLVIRGKFTYGAIMAFQGYLMNFTAPADRLIAAGQQIQEMRTNMERIEDVMEYPVDPIVEAGENIENEAYDDEDADLDKFRGTIELRHVTFGYSPLAEPLIKDFNLTIRPGGRVAFVGTSGCGKSTLSKLISGLYEPWEGEILFDGKPIKEIDRSIFTSSLAVVDQDIILFEDTIENNIKMWDDSIEDFEMILAARDAQMHDDIMERDGGYQYKITEGGKDFSGGQRQRLEIARVLAQDPTAMILDEATSALDAKTEYDVVKAIKDRGITCIVIAHRLSTIRDSDEIIVLNRGEVVERGTHDELYAKGGYYAELVTSE